MDTKAYVETLLKNRKMYQRELEHMCVQMELLSKQGENGGDAGYIAPKSAFYREMMHRVNGVRYEDVKAVHSTLKMELDRLESAMEALSERERQVLHCIYEKHMTWHQTGVKLFLSRNTVARNRAQALSNIIACFEMCKHSAG